MLSCASTSACSNSTTSNSISSTRPSRRSPTSPCSARQEPAVFGRSWKGAGADHVRGALDGEVARVVVTREAVLENAAPTIVPHRPRRERNPPDPEGRALVGDGEGLSATAVRRGNQHQRRPRTVSQVGNTIRHSSGSIAAEPVTAAATKSATHPVPGDRKRRAEDPHPTATAAERKGTTAFAGTPPPNR